METNNLRELIHNEIFNEDKNGGLTILTPIDDTNVDSLEECERYNIVDNILKIIRDQKINEILNDKL